MGYRPATPSAMVSVESVVTTRRWCQERVIAGAPSGCTQITSTSGRQGLQHVAHAGGHRAAAQRDQDGVEGGRRVGQFQADGRRALAGLDVEAVLDQPDAVVRCAMLAARSRAISKSPSTSSNSAPSARIRSSLAAGAQRDATTVTSRPRRRPDQARAWPRLPALAHTAARAALVGQQARDELGAAGLEAAHRVRRLQLDTHRAAELGLQRVAAVQRSVEKDRVDVPAGRADPGEVETRREHDQQRTPSELSLVETNSPTPPVTSHVAVGAGLCPVRGKSIEIMRERGYGAQQSSLTSLK